jgi:hypothetical protein
MKIRNCVVMAAFIGAAAIAPSMASADPTLLTILALSAVNGGAVAAPAPQPMSAANVDADPFGDVLPDIVGGGDDADGLSTGVSWRSHGVYHCHRRHSCHAHR